MRILCMVLVVAVLLASAPMTALAGGDASMGPAPNAGDGIPDGSGFDGSNSDGSPESPGPAPNSGDGIPDGSGF